MPKPNLPRLAFLLNQVMSGFQPHTRALVIFDYMDLEGLLLNLANFLWRLYGGFLRAEGTTRRYSTGPSWFARLLLQVLRPLEHAPLPHNEVLYERYDAMRLVISRAFEFTFEDLARGAGLYSLINLAARRAKAFYTYHTMVMDQSTYEYVLGEDDGERVLVVADKYRPGLYREGRENPTVRSLKERREELFARVLKVRFPRW